MTAQVWIDSTRDMLLSGYVEELDLVTTAPTPATTGTTLVVQGIASSIVKGVVIEVNAELMYVISITSTTVSVMRGYAGSTAATHTAGDIVRVSPKFPAHRIVSSINDDLADLSAPGHGLFQMKTTSFTYNGGVDGYNLAGLTSAEIDSIYSVTYADIGSEQPPTLLATSFVSPPSSQLIASFLPSTTTSLICLPQGRGCSK